MKQQTNYLMQIRLYLTYLTFIASLVFLISSDAFPQANIKVEVSGVVKDGKTMLHDALVTVYASSQGMTKEGKVSSTRSNNGKYKIMLDVKKYYLIEISKEGYVSQMIFFNTSAPEPDIEAGNTKTASVEIDLFRMIEGLNILAIKDKPTQKVRYMKQDNIFDSDKDFEDNIKPKIETIIKQLAKILQEKFYSECQEGYKSAEQKNYEEALLHYYKALEYYPGDKAALKKIADIEKRGVKKEQAYQKFKKLGDDAFNNKDYTSAIASYNKALIVNPSDAYVKNRISEAQTKSQTAQNTQTNTDTKKQYLKITGTVFKEDKKLKDATATLFEENTKVKTVTTDEKGEFTFTLDMNKNYRVEISKLGFVTQKIKASTLLPANLKTNALYWAKSFSISLFETVEGLNTASLNEPVKIIKYFATIDDFDLDKVYGATMSKKVDELIAQADNLRKNPKNLVSNTMNDQKQNADNTQKDVAQTQNQEQNQEQNKDDAKKENAVTAQNNQQTELNTTDKRTPAEKIDSCLKRVKQLQVSGDSKALSLAAGDVAELYFNSGDYDNATDYYRLSYQKKEELGDKDGASVALMNMGVVCFNNFRYEDAVKNFLNALKIKQELADKPGESKVCYRLGNVYYEKKDYEKATEYYEKSLDLDKQQKNEKDIAASYNNLGILYYELKNYGKAMDYYEKALKLNESAGQDREASIALNNIGNISYDWSKYNDALEYYEKSLKIKEKLDYKKGIAVSLFNIGNVHRQLLNYDKAISYYNKSADISKTRNFNEILFGAYSALSDVYSAQKNCEKAFDYFKSAASLKQFSSGNIRRQLSETQVKYESESLRKSEEITLLKEEVAKQKLATQTLAMKKELELSQKNEELLIKEADLKIQKIQKYAFFAGFFLVLLLAFFIYRGYRQKKKQNEIIEKKNKDLELAYYEISEKNEELHQQKEEIITQRDEIEAQKDIIEKQRDIATEQRDQITQQKQEITDSIYYAEYIQKALLQPDEDIIKTLPEHFILFMPRDIVSGDFYWLGKKKDCFIIAAADCTGHGVPGAFMSMLGISFLNEIINKLPDTGKETPLYAGEILNQLREDVIRALHQTGKEGETKDGMDIALCVYYPKKNLLYFAGAFNPMYIIKKQQEAVAVGSETPELPTCLPAGKATNHQLPTTNCQLPTPAANYQLLEIKADKMPIGIYMKEKLPFTNNEVRLEKGDMVYIFSDGFADQFGGPKNKKFGYESLKCAFLDNRQKPMQEQKEALLKIHRDWKGITDQIDDIIVIGFKV
ncbi:MAG: tetratricopeptide repeat protein [Bacteroidia bacterium]|nr:tetratricopeptide repeat protein [Bacteroidia bacterium]